MLNEVPFLNSTPDAERTALPPKFRRPEGSTIFLCISKAVLIKPPLASANLPGGASLLFVGGTFALDPFSEGPADWPKVSASSPPVKSLNFIMGPFALRPAKPPPLPPPPPEGPICGGRAPGGRPGAGRNPCGARKLPTELGDVKVGVDDPEGFKNAEASNRSSWPMLKDAELVEGDELPDDVLADPEMARLAF